MPAQYCTRHPNRETFRICGRCERPFCPDCLVTTPVGGRCAECARPARSARMVLEPWRWPLVAIVALLGALVAGVIVREVRFFGLVLSYFAGTGLGAVVLAASGRKPGKALAVVTVLSIVTGVVLSTPVWLVAAVAGEPGGPGPIGPVLAAGLRAGLLSFWGWMYAAVMAWAAWMRVR